MVWLYRLAAAAIAFWLGMIISDVIGAGVVGWIVFSGVFGFLIGASLELVMLFNQADARYRDRG